MKSTPSPQWSDEQAGALLRKAWNGMHNWFYVAVGYDWERNRETGRCWEYHDCSGTRIKRADWDAFLQVVRKSIHGGVPLRRHVGMGGLGCLRRKRGEFTRG